MWCALVEMKDASVCALVKMRDAAACAFILALPLISPLRTECGKLKVMASLNLAISC